MKQAAAVIGAALVLLLVVSIAVQQRGIWGRREEAPLVVEVDVLQTLPETTHEAEPVVINYQRNNHNKYANKGRGWRTTRPTTKAATTARTTTTRRGVVKGAQFHRN